MRLYLSPTVTFLVTISTCFGIAPKATIAQLVRPNQVVVVTANGNAESESLASYYCEQHDVDPSRVLSLKFPAGDELERDVWENELRPEIQKWLLENDANREINCFVTTFGVPLAIAKWKDRDETNRWGKLYDQLFASQLEELNKVLKQMAELSKTAHEPLGAELSAKELGKRFDEIANACQRIVGDLPADQRGGANRILQKSVRSVAGLSPFLKGMRTKLNAGAGEQLQLVSQFERTNGIQQGFNETLATMNRMPPTFDREIAITQVLERSVGTLGVIDWIRKQSALTKGNESLASFDSELCLVGKKDYRRVGVYPIADLDNVSVPGMDRIYRVTRIDGPSFEVAKSLIDRAMNVSGGGVATGGNVYVDKRGLPPSANADDLEIERWLEQMAVRFEGDESFTVTRNEGPELFDVDACPETAMYLGWYGLGKFRDSFTFAAGATAYHLVPADALWIHDPEDTGWCKGFLEKGATFVVGSVADPVIVDLGGEEGQWVDASKKLPVRPRRINCSDGSVIFGDFLYAGD